MHLHHSDRTTIVDERATVALLKHDHEHHQHARPRAPPTCTTTRTSTTEHEHQQARAPTSTNKHQHKQQHEQHHSTTASPTPRQLDTKRSVRSAPRAAPPPHTTQLHPCLGWRHTRANTTTGCWKHAAIHSWSPEWPVLVTSCGDQFAHTDGHGHARTQESGRHGDQLRPLDISYSAASPASTQRCC